MPAAVHVAIYHKGHIATLIHIQDLDVMFIVAVPLILIVLVCKTKQIGQLIVCNIIAVQPPSRDKCCHSTTAALRKRNLVSSDSKINLLIAKDLARIIKNLVHGSLIIQQIHTI